MKLKKAIKADAYVMTFVNLSTSCMTLNKKKKKKEAENIFLI